MKKGKILVVDDNAGIRSALKILLPSHFAQVELLASPSSLMTRLRDFRPEVVLLDMNFSADINTWRWCCLRHTRMWPWPWKE